MGLIFLWVFNLKVLSCVNNFPFTLIAFSREEKKEICIAKTLESER